MIQSSCSSDWSVIQGVQPCNINDVSFLVRNFFQHPTSTFINTLYHNTPLDMSDAPIGFPQSWTDNQGHVKCVARGCDKVWTTNKDLRGRFNHWDEAKEPLGARLLETRTDHKILLAMSRQRKCPHCENFTIGRTIKELYRHELHHHHSNDTGTISGFVKLLRKGLLDLEITRMAYEPVHERLLQRIIAWPRFHGHGLARFWHLQNLDGSFNVLALEGIITVPNQKQGRPLSYPMKPDKFLSDIPPEYDQRRQHAFDYAGMWTQLREMYANGTI